LTAHVDVAIIGGGPAGASAALSLARTGLRALIVERRPQRQSRAGESLAPSATTLLARLGLLPAFLATEPLPCYANRSSWGGDGRLVDYDFIRDPHGHGWHIDRQRFDQMLLDAAVAAGAGLQCGALLASPERRDGSPWLLKVQADGVVSRVEADFVIEASGRRAAFARRIGVHRTHLDRLVAAAAFLVPESRPGQDSTTLVEAVPEGWWYSALLRDGRLAAAFMTDPDLLGGLDARHKAGWLARLESTTHTRQRAAAVGCRLAGDPMVEAAGTSRLDRIAGEGWVAAGDAAAAYDPLSSHGIGVAIATGAQAARAAAASLRGDAKAPAEYAARNVAGFQRYLGMWRAYYADETRWPDSLFWSRRRPAQSEAAPLPAVI